MKYYAIIICACLLACCVPALSKKGELVQVAGEELELDQCLNLGPVTGSCGSGANSAQDTEGALNELRNHAAELGANVVVITSIDRTIFDATATGIAYQCPGE